MELNYYILLLAALVPLVIGFIWYNPKVFGTAWMNASGLTEEKMKGANMLLIFGLCYVFSILIGAMLMQIVIHQIGVMGALGGDMEAAGIKEYFADFMSNYGTNFRTFKHGALHGTMSGFLFSMPILAINAMFERKGFKYIAINAGYWIVSLGIMGGIICAYM